MPTFQIGGKLVLFVHIPKTGGTTIEKLFRTHPGYQEEALYAEGPSNLFIRTSVCSPQHWHASILKKALRINCFDLTFCIIRNPLSRILSEYSMHIGKSQGTLTTPTEKSFVEWYEESQEMRKANPFCFDNHLRSQNEFLLRKSLVATYEDGIPNIWKELCLRLTLQPQVTAIPHIRPGKGPSIPLTTLSPGTRKKIYADYEEDLYMFKQISSRRRGDSIFVRAASLLS